MTATVAIVFVLWLISLVLLAGVSKPHRRH